MNDFQKYRDIILFAWGITMLTVVIIFHVVTDPEAYLILGAAIGLPLIVGLKRSGNDNGKA